MSGQPVITSSYPGMKCAGCERPFGARTTRTRITPGGVGMIHNLRACLDLACAKVAQAQPEADAEPTPTPAEEACLECEAAPGAATAQERMVKRTGDQRREQLRGRISF